MALRVELKPHEKIIIGSCVITNFDKRTKLLIEGDHVPVLREKDILTPTTAVVASPPIASLKPGGENLVRIVRVARTPVTARESYRVLVDQLPNPKGYKPGVVGILVRHAIPLYFEP